MLQVIGNFLLIACIIIFNLVCVSKTRTLYVEKPVETKVEVKVNEDSEHETEFKSSEILEELSSTTSEVQKVNTNDINKEEVNIDDIDKEVANSNLTQQEKYEINNIRKTINSDIVIEPEVQEKVEPIPIPASESQVIQFNKYIESKSVSMVIDTLDVTEYYEDRSTLIDVRGRNVLMIGDSRVLGISRADERTCDFIAISGVRNGSLARVLEKVSYRYDKIIILSSVNDLWEDFQSTKREISKDTLDGTNSLMYTAMHHLTPNGYMYYVTSQVKGKYAGLQVLINELESQLILRSGPRWSVIVPEYTIEHSISSDGIHFANFKEYRQLRNSIFKELD